MSECICSECRNLKLIIDDQGETGEYECEFGFPSEDCGGCGGEGCEITCGHFASDEEPAEVQFVKCKSCGKELEQLCSDPEEGDVYCVNCFLKER